jgi:hypothetical protein
VTCSYTIDPHDQSFDKDGGTGVIRVTAPAGCRWSASTNADWIVVLGAGAGNGTVGYGVAPFRGGDAQRTGTISVAGQSVTVTQQGDKGKKD